MWKKETRVPFSGADAVLWLSARCPCFGFLLLLTAVIGVRSKQVVCILSIIIGSVQFRGSRDLVLRAEAM